MDSKISWADIPMDDVEPDDGFTKVESKKTKKKNKKKNKKKSTSKQNESETLKPNQNRSLELENLLVEWTRWAYHLYRALEECTMTIWECLELTEDEWDDILALLNEVDFKTSLSKSPPKDNWAQVLDSLPVRPPKRQLIEKFIQNTKAFEQKLEEEDYYYYDDDDGYFVKPEEELSNEEPSKEELLHEELLKEVDQEYEDVQDDDDGYFAKPEEVPEEQLQKEKVLEEKIQEDHPVYMLIKQDSRCLSLFNELTLFEQVDLLVSFKHVWKNFNSNPNLIVQPMERHIESLYYLIGSTQDLDFAGLHFKGVFMNTVNWLKQ